MKISQSDMEHIKKIKKLLSKAYNEMNEVSPCRGFGSPCVTSVDDASTAPPAAQALLPGSPYRAAARCQPPHRRAHGCHPPVDGRAHNPPAHKVGDYRLNRRLNTTNHLAGWLVV
jgi:hypothetical protein